ncbi:uncharacterized protein L199_003043 [Kwoniella botswanensis]|uniref:uncharacterized protein n=1 Tax=Kwoniella botswanensis TaxID=1268659 RepID=UPI00315E0025
MFLSTFTSLFPLILLPSVLAVLEGSVKVNFPSTTSATQTTELGDIPEEGSTRTITFSDVNDKKSFYWYGPTWVEEGRPQSEERRSWKQECQVWANEGFNKDIEFTLRTQSAGLVGPKDQGGHIKCTLINCLIPDGKGECEGEWVVPVVDSSSTRTSDKEDIVQGRK